MGWVPGRSTAQETEMKPGVIMDGRCPDYFDKFLAALSVLEPTSDSAMPFL